MPLPSELVKASHVLAVLFASVAATLAVTQPSSDPDLFWHLASGDWMLDHGRLLDRDVFSFTREGMPYTAGQWLGQVSLALAFRAGEWPGIALMRAALVGVATLFLAGAVLRLQAHPGWAAPPIVAAILVSRLAWGDRPQLFTLALFPIFLYLLLRARDGGGHRALYVLPPLMLLWSNLHGAFVLGLALLLVFAVESQLTGHRHRREFGITLLASALASVLNPSGLIAATWAGSYAASAGQRVLEERPTDVLSPAGLISVLLLCAALGAALALGLAGVRSRVGSPLLWSGLIIPFALLGLAIQRQLPYACDVLAVFVAAAVPAALGRRHAVAPTVPRPLALTAVAVLVALLLVVGGIGAPREPDLAAYPTGSLAELRGRPGNLLHEYDWGGYLIRVAPEHPTFIDGRLFPFVPDVLVDWTRAVEVRPGYAEVLERHDIRLVLLRPHRPLVAALREQGWPVVAEEAERWVLLVRP